jgi:hypothetical protein
MVMLDKSKGLILIAVIILIFLFIGFSLAGVFDEIPLIGSGDTDIFNKPGSEQGETGIIEPPPPTVIPEYDTIIMVTVLCGIIAIFIVARRYQ